MLPTCLIRAQGTIGQKLLTHMGGLGTYQMDSNGIVQMGHARMAARNPACRIYTKGIAANSIALPETGGNHMSRDQSNSMTLSSLLPAGTVTTVLAEVGRGSRRNCRWRLRGTVFATCFLLGAQVSLLFAHSEQANQAARFQTAASILALSPDKTVEHGSAHLRGVVIRSTEWGFGLVDRTAGIWVNYDHPAKEFKPGDELDVTGVSGTGLYSPVLIAKTIRRLGWAPLPRPTPVNFRKLSTGDYDAQYVTLTGTVRSVGIRPRVAVSQNFWMKVQMSDGVV